MHSRAFFVFALLGWLAIAMPGCSARHASSRGSSAAASASFDRVRGKAIFAARCQSCHGIAGTGGPIGPPLVNDYRKRSFDDVIAIVKDPDPPMPKLFPGHLSQADVVNVSAYVESLR
ncbi:MAG: cytochrome c [Candidatus Eremiobacteraeota bacterium]|nr:cytochrome c [Candidatus Eremiobacteraeota bacterium]